MGNPYPYLDAILPSAAEMHEAAVLAHYERRLAEDAATIADLRSRLLMLAQWVCPQCDVTPLGVGEQGELWPRCPDCMIALWGGDGKEAACFASGMKALCGRRILEGVE